MTLDFEHKNGLGINAVLEQIADGRFASIVFMKILCIWIYAVPVNPRRQNFVPFMLRLTHSMPFCVHVSR